MVDCSLEHLKVLHHSLIDLIQHIANMVPQLESTFHEVACLLDHLAWHLKLQMPSTKECSRCVAGQLTGKHIFFCTLQ